jgi:hypothetical protein
MQIALIFCAYHSVSCESKISYGAHYEGADVLQTYKRFCYYTVCCTSAVHSLTRAHARTRTHTHTHRDYLTWSMSWSASSTGGGASQYVELRRSSSTSPTTNTGRAANCDSNGSGGGKVGSGNSVSQTHNDITLFNSYYVSAILTCKWFHTTSIILLWLYLVDPDTLGKSSINKH